MKRILISILSEQLIPNYLFIKEQKGIDKYIFLTTDQMEKLNKTNALCETAGITKDNSIKINISEDLLYANIESLVKLNLSQDDEYVVNLTGGTKMMAIAVWRFFSKFKKVRYFYLPLNKNQILEVFDEKLPLKSSINYNLSVHEFLKLNNVRFEEKSLELNEHEIYETYKKLKDNDFDLSFLKLNLNPTYTPPNDAREYQKYTKWFEEFIYHSIKNAIGLNDQQIKTGILIYDILQEKKIEHNQNDNEIDIIFIKENILYLIECKFTVGLARVNTEKLLSSMYKLVTISNRLGAQCKKYIFTLSCFKNLSKQSKENLLKKQVIHKTNILACEDLKPMDNHKFKEIFS